ncbi:substrate-binding domain-containing protein [Rhizobium calliandrae]|uniref:Substrate-binding domain-containing protein n=1 Tax=Rhizobium calliandrae TaxID=1312182 RepID=A0ABT7KKQ5_9HYPH|nr:substrate-binding domain-containing protein [Rhizobium calliandrae]MDL2407843.1 substrate-binding domain-containing protein [Rhizobium calliandrae]
MAISRRAFGVGLLAAGVAGTGGFFAVKDKPEFQGLLGNRTKLFGFIGGEKEAFLADNDVVGALHGYGLDIDSRVTGSVEMVREQALLSQAPAFLWPSSSIMVDIARQSGVKIRNDRVVLNTPVVVYTWQPVVDGLMKAGLVSVTATHQYQLDLKALLDAVLAGTSWSKLGIDALYGQARIVSTDPNRSNSGFMFAGLVLSLFAGNVATSSGLAQFGDKAQTIFRNMGFKSPSSGKLFDQYLAGGLGGEPMIVGYENQLVEWIIADPERWKRVQSSSTAKPVMLYPHPTVYSSHPLIVVDETANRLMDALSSPKLQELAFTKHGFRGQLGTATGNADSAIAGLLPAEIDAVLPIPDANVMLALLDKLAA